MVLQVSECCQEIQVLRRQLIDTSRCARDGTLSVGIAELGFLKAGRLAPLPRIGLNTWEEAETAFLELLWSPRLHWISSHPCSHAGI